MPPSELRRRYLGPRCRLDDDMSRLRADSIEEMMPGDLGLTGREHQFLTWTEACQLFSLWEGLSGFGAGQVLRIKDHPVSFFNVENTRHLTKSVGFLCQEDTKLKIRTRGGSWGFCYSTQPELDLFKGLNIFVWMDSLLDLTMTTRENLLGSDHRYILMPDDERDIWTTKSVRRGAVSMREYFTWNFSGEFYLRRKTNWRPVWMLDKIVIVLPKRNPVLSLEQQARLSFMNWEASCGNFPPYCSAVLPRDYRVPGLTTVRELWPEQLIRPIWESREDWTRRNDSVV